MNKSLKDEKKLYFKNKKDYLISKFTKEHNYLIWKYIYFLRNEENSKTKIIKLFFRHKKNKLGVKLGFLIYPNTCGKGIKIWHYGSIIINGFSKIGINCILHGQNCIGNNGKDLKAPVIGDNVEIGFGAIVIGDVFIANNVKIGAGAVVTKSCYKEGAVLIGVPAREKGIS